MLEYNPEEIECIVAHELAHLYFSHNLLLCVYKIVSFIGYFYIFKLLLDSEYLPINDLDIYSVNTIGILLIFFLIFNFIILVFVTISKFYPIVLGIILFFEKNLKKIFINLLIFLITISLIFFIQSDQMIKIFENRGQSAGFGVYEFSLIGTIKFFKNSLSFNNFKYFVH